MADIADRAAEAQQIAIDDALAAHSRRKASETPRVYCIDCDEVIPHQRRRHGVSRCVECQEFEERRAAHRDNRDD